VRADAPLLARLTPRIAAGPEAYSRARMLLARAGLQAALREAAVEPLLVAETAADIAVLRPLVLPRRRPGAHPHFRSQDG
jgi:hypothetical protein